MTCIICGRIDINIPTTDNQKINKFASPNAEVAEPRKYSGQAGRRVPMKIGIYAINIVFRYN